MSAVPDREAAGSRDDDEPALVARALAGDRTALGVLVTRFAAPVRRLAYAILRDADEADDAAQDGVLQALVKLDRYDPSRPFGPWLMRIVANAAIDRRRRRAVRETSELDEGLVGGGPLPDVEVDRLALRQRLAMALDTLPQRYRMALVLFDVEGYSQAEIAEILGVAPGTVRSAVFHARRRLRRWLEGWKEGGGES
ncbi:MAG: RNA polymerase subunit sigma-24 [Gemmatimonadetes bacterium]|nr:MAG: RNA polymerase subunit sigma-24 [Gemmatimonadota bacterium]PYO99265.1 MAG: RNA polymerase subunit sigma-24 [Gemmatimonadota bacterium]